MHSPESSASKQPKFQELELDKQTIDYVSETEAFEKIMSLLEENGLRRDGLLYSGINGTPLKETGKSGKTDDTYTYAVNEAEFRQNAENADRFGGDVLSPLFYAYEADEAGDIPAIAIYDSEKFRPLKAGSGEKRILQHGYTLDDAIQAVIYLT
jgi:hypothetical protein